MLNPHELEAAGTLSSDIAVAGGAPPLPASGMYSEGASFWTMGTERARVLVEARGHRSVEVTVHIGPSGGRCRTSVNGNTQAQPLQPNETRVLRFDRIPPEAVWVPVTVQASHAFRPAAVDPQSRDERLLGCQVQVALR
jgi:hypothetical protein